MNTTATGTERQHAYSSAVEGSAGQPLNAGYRAAQDHETPEHFEAEAQLRRLLGETALRELESRLGAVGQRDPRPFEHGAPPQTQPWTQTGVRSAWEAPAPHAAMPDASRYDEYLSLSDRLRELSTYLHASLAEHATGRAAHPSSAKPRQRQAQPRVYSEWPLQAQPQPQPQPRVHTQPPFQPKLTPTAPVLDRAWFEERFTQLRDSINDVAEVPAKRLDTLEAQFRLLMERLDARESAQGGMGAVEAGLKNLAAYLEDSKKWATRQDQRQRSVEERLDQLSGLVAQSHAAISATAKGLEIVARGTGPQLARHTADLVAAHVEQKIGQLTPGSQLDTISREIANLSTQQRQYARATDQRLKELQIFLESAEERDAFTGADPLAQQQATTIQAELEARAAAQPRVHPQPERKVSPANGEAHFAARPQGTDEADSDDYDRDLIAAAQRAARLAEGPRRDVHAHGEPVRYQIPYGEFLPEEDRRSQHLGLIAAAVILLLASAAMLYLNLREKDVFGWARGSTAPANTMQERAPVTVPVPPAAVRTQPVNSTAAIRKLPAAAPVSGETAPKTQGAETDKAQPGALSATETGSPPDSVKTQAVAAVESRLTEAAVAGEPNAQFAVGQKLLNAPADDLDIRDRLSMAARWFRRAAENGHAPSQYRLATLFELGQGAPKNYLMAEAWYSRAAEAGHVKAMHNLAVLKVGARGGNANYLAAAKWFTKAAEHGLTDSQYNLAILYERGMGVEPSTVKAYQWYAIAARFGDAKAAQKRDALAAKITPPERTATDTLVAGWSAQARDPKANGAPVELPVRTEAQPAPAHPATKPEKPRVQTMKMSWTTEVQGNSTVVMKAQNRLIDLGYKVGKADGLLGPRTVAAAREFELSQGVEPTGRVDEALIARLEFAHR